MHARTIHDLGAIVRGRRADLGWSQGVAAAHAGVSRKWVSDLETGRTSPDLTTVLRLLEVLGLGLDVTTDVTTEVLAAAAGKPVPPPIDLDELLSGYERT